LWFLETNHLLANTQNGFRKQRSTMDNIIFLESKIREAFNLNQKTLCLFFDLEKAFDMTWQHGVLKTLSSWGLQGHIHYFISNFLKNRMFTVRANGCTSSERTPENGCPQGSVLSPTLFLIALNSIQQQISFPSISAIYADDLVVFATGKNLETLEEELQDTLRNLEAWSHSTGFHFSSEKTKYIVFSKRRTDYTPTLTLYNQTIEKVPCIRFLGVIFDSQLTWKSHISSIVSSCNKQIGLLRILGHHTWGADTGILLSVYKSLVRSRLEYGLIAYGACSKTTREPIEVLQRAALRIILGAYRTTPSDSLYVLSREMPLQLRFEQLTLNYAAQIYSQPSHPNHSLLYPPLETVPKHTKLSFMPIAERIHLYLQRHSLSFPPSFYKPELRIPPWSIPSPKILFDLATYSKNVTNPSIIISQEFCRLRSKYPTATFLYTDGSKISGALGAAVHTSTRELKIKLTPYGSIFCAELAGLLEAVQLALRHVDGNFIICSDSHSALQAIQHRYSTNPLVQKIAEERKTALLLNKDSMFMYTPSHVGITGNGRADELAKSAALDAALPETNYGLYTDWKSIIKSAVINTWQSQWDLDSSHLHRKHPLLIKIFTFLWIGGLK
jgi:ribonuclease HI